MTSLEASEGARRARHFRALERRLFEVMGQWVPSAPEPEAKLVLRRQSFQHAWHAELWAGILPASEADRPTPLSPRLAAVLESAAGPTTTAVRLAGIYRVVMPRLVTAYGRLSDEATEVADGPLVRALELILADDVGARRTGEGLLERLLPDGAEAEACAAHAGRLDAMLMAGGGVDHIGEE